MIISGDYKVLLSGDEALVEYLHEWCSVFVLTERNLYMDNHNTSGHGCLILTIHYEFLICRGYVDVLDILIKIRLHQNS